ncbi:ATP-binding cassette domain-containing protein [Nodosilinea sp. P-1105]|uniref:ABC transporter ATP-binding protein n=1 Tax=Nodosilinea sp. P-1105 TaxID=2546229 RepID=UPI00146E639A|nr:ATP-binding cassette domain-containing protein [Nodosilinea sp. P-1105]NMF83287.1 ATP-binding cassette domain-containing protein [Nodosilinea sp. P-1105]
MGPSQPLLVANNLGRCLGERWLWRGVSFDLAAGECLGLVAPSGAGKTLLMRNLVLLDPCQQGEVRFAGKTPAEWTMPTYRTQVMYMPQRPAALDGTVQENLERVFELAVYGQQHFDPDKIESWLQQLGRSPDFLHLQAARLSGGEAQILALLRGLQVNPPVLLLDEPTASLDGDATTRVEGLLSNWLQQPDHACVFTSHDTAQIHRVADRQLNLGDFT